MQPSAYFNFISLLTFKGLLLHIPSSLLKGPL